MKTTTLMYLNPLQSYTFEAKVYTGFNLSQKVAHLIHTLLHLPYTHRCFLNTQLFTIHDI